MVLDQYQPYVELIPLHVFADQLRGAFRDHNLGAKLLCLA
jgi:hypothetical protein